MNDIHMSFCLLTLQRYNNFGRLSIDFSHKV